jgi:hypothetical protein
VQIGDVRRFCAPGIDDDDLHLLRGLLFAPFDAAEHDGMALGGIAADDEKAVGALHIGIRRWWAV